MSFCCINRTASTRSVYTILFSIFCVFPVLSGVVSWEWSLRWKETCKQTLLTQLGEALPEANKYQWKPSSWHRHHQTPAVDPTAVQVPCDVHCVRAWTESESTGLWTRPDRCVYEVIQGCLRLWAAVALFSGSSSNMVRRNELNWAASSRGHSYLSSRISNKLHGFRFEMCRRCPVRRNK